VIPIKLLRCLIAVSDHSSILSAMPKCHHCSAAVVQTGTSLASPSLHPSVSSLLSSNALCTSPIHLPTPFSLSNFDPTPVSLPALPSVISPPVSVCFHLVSCLLHLLALTTAILLILYTWLSTSYPSTILPSLHSRDIPCAARGPFVVQNEDPDEREEGGAGDEQYEKQYADGAEDRCES